MKAPARLGAISSLALVMLLAACGGDSTAPAPSASEDALDLAALDGGASLPGTMMSEAPTAPSGRSECRFSDESGRYNCAPITRDGLTFVRSFAFFDAAGHAQRRFDRLTTEATNNRVAVHGTTTTRESAVVRVRKVADMTVSGQSGEEKQHTLNGTEIGVTNAEITSDRGVRVVHTEFTDASVNVVVAVPRERGSWPLSGQTIRARLVREGMKDAELSRPAIHREVTTFNGTNLVRVQISSPRGTFSCVRNLETRKTECASGR